MRDPPGLAEGVVAVNKPVVSVDEVGDPAVALLVFVGGERVQGFRALIMRGPELLFRAVRGRGAILTRALQAVFQVRNVRAEVEYFRVPPPDAGLLNAAYEGGRNGRPRKKCYCAITHEPPRSGIFAKHPLL